MIKNSINFYCLGAQKAGTTTLHDLLKDHPDIYLPEFKEAAFYQDDRLFKKGVNWYLQNHFLKKQSEKIVGSISPEFLYYPWVAPRIQESFGSEIKFIVILRNPVKRALSHFNMSVGRGIEKLDFFEAINLESERITGSYYNRKHFSYIDRGLYSKQISRYFEYFPHENFLFLKFEEFIKDQSKYLGHIYDFLNIPSVEMDEEITSNSAFEYSVPIIGKLESKYPILSRKVKQLFPPSYRKKVSSLYKKPFNSYTVDSEADVQRLILEFFIEDIKISEKLTGLDLESWYNPRKDL